MTGIMANLDLLPGRHAGDVLEQRGNATA